MNRQAGRINWKHEMRGSKVQPEEKGKKKEMREDQETCEHLPKLPG